jgi:hypothetical protein
MAEPQAVVAVRAERQHASINHLAGAVGFSFDTARVGGPDPLAAIGTRMFARTRRLTGLPVSVSAAVRALAVTASHLGAGPFECP